jgi:hypothetical protein
MNHIVNVFIPASNKELHPICVGDDITKKIAGIIADGALSFGCEMAAMHEPT